MGREWTGIFAAGRQGAGEINAVLSDNPGTKIKHVVALPVHDGNVGYSCDILVVFESKVDKKLDNKSLGGGR